MEQGPTFPNQHEISWHDVTLQMIRRKISSDELEAARIMAEVRLRGVSEAILDVEDALAKNMDSIGPTAWEQEKAALAEDIEELEKLLLTIKIKTRD